MLSIGTNSPFFRLECSLEENLKEQVCIEFEEDEKSECDQYLSPNEGNPQNIAPHLALMEDGVLVTPGTQRIFFDAGQVPLEKCIGIVGRDTNRNAKRIDDFIILLFRISMSGEDMRHLATCPENELAKELRLYEIGRRIVDDQLMSLFMKVYYLNNYRNFGDLFYTVDQSWMESEAYRQTNYFNNESLFIKIKQYAVAGKIVSTVGDINDLAFLRNYPIGIVDASNVHRSTCIDLRGPHMGNPVRVIWTDQNKLATTYHSFMYKNLNDEEREELKGLHECLQNALNCNQEELAYRLKTCMEYSSWAFQYTSSNPVLWASFSQAALIGLREYCKERLYQIPCFGFIDMEWLHIDKLNTVPPHLLSQVIKDPKFERFVDVLVRGWGHIDFPLYIDLMVIPGWKEAFEKDMKKEPRMLEDFQECAESCGSWQIFVDRFGKERIERLMSK